MTRSERLAKLGKVDTMYDGIAKVIAIEKVYQADLRYVGSEETMYNGHLTEIDIYISNDLLEPEVYAVIC